MLKISVLYCSNGLNNSELDHYLEEIENCQFSSISLPCSGKVNIPYMVKAFETGSDGLVIITCKQGQCHNLEGNIRAQKRAQAVESLLEEVGFSKGLIKVIQLTDSGIEKAAKEIKEFCNTLGKLSANTDNNVKNKSKTNKNLEKTT